MIGTYIRRGLAAGALAGLLAGLFALVVGEPALDEAIALEEAAAAGDASHPQGAPHPQDEDVFSRPTQKAGLVVGSALIGVAVGALLGLVSAWAIGRVNGDGWTRALKIGATATTALVVFPALRYAPNPPGIGDPDTIGTRTALYLGTAVIGVLLAVVAWTGARQLAGARLSRPVRQLTVALGVVVVGGLLLMGLPAAADPGTAVPGELLWRFRLSSIATQALLWLGTAVGIGLLTARSEPAA